MAALLLCFTWLTARIPGGCSCCLLYNHAPETHAVCILVLPAMGVVVLRLLAATARSCCLLCHPVCWPSMHDPAVLVAGQHTGVKNTQ